VCVCVCVCVYVCVCVLWRYSFRRCSASATPLHDKTFFMMIKYFVSYIGGQCVATARACVYMHTGVF